MTRTRKTLLAAVVAVGFVALAASPASAKDTKFKSKSYYDNMEHTCGVLEGDFSEDDDGYRACDRADGSYTVCSPQGACTHHEPRIVRSTTPRVPVATAQLS